MKKILILAGLVVVTTSCTYEDVVSFLKGESNNLTETEKQQVLREQNLIEDKDRGNTPPQH